MSSSYMITSVVCFRLNPDSFIDQNVVLVLAATFA